MAAAKVGNVCFAKKLAWHEKNEFIPKTSYDHLTISALKGGLNGKEWSKWGEISCQFLPPGGGIVPRYVLQLLFSEKSKNC